MAHTVGQSAQPPPLSSQIRDRSVLCSTSMYNEDGPSIYCNDLWFEVVHVMLDITDVDLCILNWLNIKWKYHVKQQSILHPLSLNPGSDIGYLLFGINTDIIYYSLWYLITKQPELTTLPEVISRVWGVEGVPNPNLKGEGEVHLQPDHMRKYWLICWWVFFGFIPYNCFRCVQFDKMNVAYE